MAWGVEDMSDSSGYWSKFPIVRGPKFGFPL